jgi:hypothetical protein
LLKASSHQKTNWLGKEYLRESKHLNERAWQGFRPVHWFCRPVASGLRRISTSRWSVMQEQFGSGHFSEMATTDPGEMVVGLVFQTGSAINTAPVTYTLGGKQCVFIASGTNLIVFALP